MIIMPVQMLSDSAILSFHDAILAESPLLLWGCDSPSGDTVLTDLSGNSRNGTVVLSQISGFEQVGQYSGDLCFNLNTGNTGLVCSISDSSMASISSYTIIALEASKNLSSGNSVLDGGMSGSRNQGQNGQNCFANSNVGLAPTSGTGLLGRVRVGSTDTNFASTAWYMTAGHWRLIAMTWDETNAKIYGMNPNMPWDVYASVTPATGGPAGGTNDWIIGGASGASSSGNPKRSAFAVFDRALSAAELEVIAETLTM